MRLGTHEVAVDCHNVSINPNTGTWTARFWFVWEEDGEPQKIAGNVYFTEKAIRIARKSLKALGFNPDTQKIADLDENQTLLRGNRCEIEIVEEEYPEGSGEVSIKVKWINAIRNKKEEEEEGNRIDNLLRDAGSDKSKAKARSASPPVNDDADPFGQPPPLTDADVPPPPGDDIPF